MKITNLSIKQLTRETIIGYVFWSFYQGLPPMIWFYPLNELEITGYEAFALAGISPLLYGFKPLRCLLQSNWCMALLRIGTVLCLASFQMETTHMRLIVLATGLFLNLLIVTGTFWSDSHYQRVLSTVGFLLGLMSFIVSRIWFTSFIPTWWSVSSNNVVIALAALATVDKIASDDDDLGSNCGSKSVRSGWLVTGLGCASLLCITHTFFGEVSIVTRWVVRQYPNSGPNPNPCGFAIAVCLVLGLLLGFSRPQIAKSFCWWVASCLSLAAVYLLPTWQGFVGGLFLAIYTMSVWPYMLDRLVSTGATARVMTLSVALHYILLFYSVWTVAYNFVPGGVYTREHTGWGLSVMIICVGLACLTDSMKVQPKSVFQATSSSKTSLSKAKLVLILILLAALLGFAWRQNPNRYDHPVKKQPKADFSAAIWTYHFGYDNKGWPSLERSAQLLNNTGADVITLLESDASKPFLGNNDLGMWLGEKLGMYVDYGPSTKDHTWGNLILSKYPIVKSEHLLLPSPEGELAPGVVATIDMSGMLVDFVVTHMGNDRDVLDRKLQAEVLANRLKNAKNPVVFLGYVTSAPKSRDYQTLIRDGNVKDIDSTDSQRWCEYIMYRGLIKLGYARISHGGLSDTEVQMGKFRIPQDPGKFEDNSKIVTDASKIPEDVKFNKVFGKYQVGHNWVDQHKFHMSTPKYFIK